MARWNTAFHTVEVRRFAIFYLPSLLQVVTNPLLFVRRMPRLAGCGCTRQGHSRGLGSLSVPLHCSSVPLRPSRPTHYARIMHAQPALSRDLLRDCSQMRMKKLEEIRLEVDSRRRTVQELTVKVPILSQCKPMKAAAKSATTGWPSGMEPAE